MNNYYELPTCVDDIIPNDIHNIIKYDKCVLAVPAKNSFRLPADIWEGCRALFDAMDTSQYILTNCIDDHEPTVDRWQDPYVPHKSYSIRHSGPVYGYDEDYMAGPHDWFKDDDTPAQNDYVMRRKLYIYNWTQDKLAVPFPQLNYFFNVYNTFYPLLNAYEKIYMDQYLNIEKYIHKLMIIEYSTPTSNTPQHRKHCTERFGDKHCDETLGGLHLGENYSEFIYYDEDTQTKFDFSEHFMWMHGLYAKYSGYIPTYHGMIHNPGDVPDKRYSIIFDLQPRYYKEK